MIGKAFIYYMTAIVVLVSVIIIPNYVETVDAEVTFPNTISLNYSFDTPLFKTMHINGEKFTRIEIKDLQMYGDVGEPRLPVKPVKILLPPSSRVKKIEIGASDGKKFNIDDMKQIELGTQAYSLDKKTPVKPPLPQYDSTQLYPSDLYRDMGVQYFRGYAILHVNLHPIQYLGETDTFYFYDNIVVTVETEQSLPNPLFRGFSIDKSIEIENIENPDMIDAYKNFNCGNQCYSLYDYVIITTEDLKNSIGIYTFFDLIEQRESQGLTCRFKTVEDIEIEYDGIDTQEKIRNFIKDAYLNWGTTWVLLGGDVEKVPIRYLYDIDGENEVLASDLYYQCLDGDYNYDGDAYWGEKYDGVDGDRIDLYAEVYLGRAPVDDGVDISSFVEKTLSYENSEWGVDNYLERHLSAGEEVWNGPGGFGAGYAERCIDYCTDYDQNTYGLPSSTYSIIKLYERDEYWEHIDVVNEINEGVNIINHVGHGTCNGAMKLTSNNISSLDNMDKYSFFYSQACHSGRLEIKDECIAEAWVNTEKAGGFAAIMNSGLGYGGTTDYDGPDNRYAREFFDALFSSDEKISRLGRANQDSKEDNIWRIDESGMKMYHVYYDTLLFGDPYVQIKGSEDTNADFIWNPTYPTTGESISFTDKSTGSIPYREWEFGDGGYSFEENPSHSYIQKGTYSVTLTIWNTEGDMSSKTREIEVKNYWYPIAVAKPEYYSGNKFTIEFTGNDSWDPDGTIVSYEWNFDDGTTSDKVDPTHEFISEGEYNVQLIVTDDDGKKGVAYCYIGIGLQMPPDKPSIPIGPTTGLSGNQYTFTVSTTDPEEDDIKYGWDFDDGSSIYWSNLHSSGEICTITHSWNLDGIYSIRVMAKDTNGAESDWSDPLILIIGDNDNPTVEITKPEKAVYIKDNRIMPFFSTLIFGGLNIEGNADDLNGIRNVEFYIDDELKANLFSEPYVWNWSERSPLKFKHTIKLIAYDIAGNSASKEMNVWKFF